MMSPVRPRVSQICNLTSHFGPLSWKLERSRFLLHLSLLDAQDKRLSGTLLLSFMHKDALGSSRI